LFVLTPYRRIGMSWSGGTGRRYPPLRATLIGWTDGRMGMNEPVLPPHGALALHISPYLDSSSNELEHMFLCIGQCEILAD
jgi:hypothetical protein